MAYTAWIVTKGLDNEYSCTALQMMSDCTALDGTRENARAVSF